ncbi:MAG: D-lyxose/D-mannose family sugar isomerase [Rhodobacteraceae bacterium]|nr:D-lyxose/D-mannose family sugar isomerase [Paracoccaceae bacterium]
MKRSEINRVLRAGDEFIQSFGYILPPFAHWPAEKMKANKTRLAGIISAKTGWDITDYGQGDFNRLGLFLFTTRNGSQADLQRGGGMCYAEKIMISRQDQISPMHRHILKAEDIINRGGATLAIKMFASDASGHIAHKSDVHVISDGQALVQKAGEILLLEPGQSVTLMPGNWHEFWGEGGDVLIGEVSTVNDDQNDNIFEAPIGRFADIIEDEPPLYLLVSDYDKWLC